MVAMAVEKTDLGNVRKRLIQNLSKGYRQRVGLAQAIVSNPEVLVLDEPTVGLDPRQVAEVRQLIKELAGQHTIILSTHILPEVQASCQRIIIINKGKIVAEDSLESLGRRMKSSSRVHLRVSASGSRTPSADDLNVLLRQVQGVQNINSPSPGLFEIDTDGSKDVTPNLAAKAVASGAGLLELREENFNLEDVFLKLTTSEETQGDSKGVTK
jgi:ABC-2 type transport system ATP-binding protein